MLTAILAAVFGLLIGSFLNVCIYRMPRDLSVVRPRSFCPACKHPVAWYDNVPVLSYLLLGGRCRHCRARISLRYPVVEIATALLFFPIALKFGASLLSLKLCVFAAINLVLFFTDLEEEQICDDVEVGRILPDQLTIGGIFLGLLFALVAPFPDTWTFQQRWGVRLGSLFEAVLAAALIGGMLWLVARLYLWLRHKEGMGIGDLKMLAMIGAFLGLQGAVLTVMLGSILGTVIGLAYALGTGKDWRTYQLPFGTFLSAAAIAVALLTSPPPPGG